MGRGSLCKAWTNAQRFLISAPMQLGATANGGKSVDWVLGRNAVVRRIANTRNAWLKCSAVASSGARQALARNCGPA